ncbi:MAG: hypothetical protein NZU63_01060 [Gemmataceae bacterium]|nr:hypothetical protein [Gemmataceae bacterium]MDW8241776.1 hypothetical protein [Thermogemmata sp.]
MVNLWGSKRFAPLARLMSRFHAATWYRRFGRPWFWLTTAVIAGVCIRLSVYTWPRCLWIDECMLALNILNRSWVELTRPLDWHQGAPLGFLFLLKGATEGAGDSEAALRLIPWLASMAGLMIFTVLATRLLPAWVAAGAVGLYAFCPALVSYCAECKQYAVDATVAVGLFLLHEWCRQSWSFVRMATLGLTGMTVLWFSYPAAFVLAGCGTALMFQSWQNRWQKPHLGAVIAIGFGWLVSFALLYLVQLRHLVKDEYLRHYWQSHFLPSEVLAWPVWLWDHLLGGLALTVGKGGALLAGIFASLGAIRLGRHRPEWLLIIGATVGTTLFAAACHRYPFAGRMILFLVPAVILLAAWGTCTVWEWCAGRARPVAITLIALMYLSAPADTLRQWPPPERTEQIQPLLQIVQQQWQPGDKVFVLRCALPAFVYYTREVPPPPGVVWSQAERFVGKVAAEEWSRLADASRIWVLASHCHREEEAVVRTLATTTAQEDGVWRQTGAWLLRYKSLSNPSEPGEVSLPDPSRQR